MTDFDDVIEDLGTFGPFQIQLVVLASLFEVVPMMCWFMPVFIEALPEWKCPLLNNTNYNGTYLNNSTNISHLAEEERITIGYISADGNMSDIQMCHTDGTFCEGAIFMTPGMTIRTEWDFCGKTFLISPITMLPMVGAFFGAFIFGQLGDTFGRKPILFVSYGLLLLAQGVMTFAHVWHLYMICRFLVGFAGIGVSLLNFVLPVEVVGKHWRSLCAVPIFGICGGMLLSLMAYLLPNWRHLSITCAAMGVPLLFTWWLIPESPRWHMQKGHIREADVIIHKIADSNNKEIPEFSKVTTCNSESKHCIVTYSYCDLFRGRSMVRNILILMFIWFVCSICYNASFNSIGTFVPDPYVNFFLLQASELPVYVFVILVSDKLGRTKCISTLMMIAGLSCLVILLAETLGILADMEWQVKGCALLTKGSIAGAWVVARIMCAELFPTLLRCVGTGACKMAFELGKLMVPLIVSLDKAIRPKSFPQLGRFFSQLWENILSDSTTSPVITSAKYEDIINYLKSPDMKVDSHFKAWVKNRKFQLMNIPEMGIENVIDLPNRKQDNQSRPLPYIVLGCMTLCTAVVSLCLPETVDKNMPDSMPPRQWCGCCGGLDSDDRDIFGHRHRNYSESQCVETCVPLSDYEKRETEHDRLFRT